jgi:hypothetical protein
MESELMKEKSKSRIYAMMLQQYDLANRPNFDGPDDIC